MPKIARVINGGVSFYSHAQDWLGLAITGTTISGSWNQTAVLYLLALTHYLCGIGTFEVTNKWYSSYRRNSTTNITVYGPKQEGDKTIPVLSLTF